MKKKLVAFALTALLVFVALQLSGCEQKAGASCPPDCTKPCCAGEDAEAKACPPDCTKPCCAAETAEAAVGDAVAAAGEQTVCPVMKAPINKELFVEYKGKKVYFCCPGCEETFNKDPEKYIKDLPQFN